MDNPHANIVTLYAVEDTYIDMEVLNTDLSGVARNAIKTAMQDVQKHLHSLGIMYIDWKLDNIGISDDGHIKLFDFDVSGTIHTKTSEWELKPLEYYSYIQAVEHGMQTPVEIDNYVFSTEIMRL
jgi:serine/threonine protein kinase